MHWVLHERAAELVDHFVWPIGRAGSIHWGRPHPPRGSSHPPGQDPSLDEIAQHGLYTELSKQITTIATRRTEMHKHATMNATRGFTVFKHVTVRATKRAEMLKHATMRATRWAEMP